MDRFIAEQRASACSTKEPLKSNMGRFIVDEVQTAKMKSILFLYLKSNMDRFIVQFKFENPER